MDRHRMKMTMSWIYQQRTTSDGLTLRIHAHVNKNGERERERGRWCDVERCATKHIGIL